MYVNQLTYTQKKNRGEIALADPLSQPVRLPALPEGEPRCLPELDFCIAKPQVQVIAAADLRAGGAVVAIQVRENKPVSIFLQTPREGKI